MDDLLKQAEARFREVKPWRVLYEPDGEGSLPYAMEEAIGESVARGEAPATLRIWQGPRALVVAKKDLRTSQAVKAAQMMKEVDWPVYAPAEWRHCRSTRPRHAESVPLCPARRR